MFPLPPKRVRGRTYEYLLEENSWPRHMLLSASLSDAPKDQRKSLDRVYPADINLPGTLVGKCLRSPYAYARILSIDASAARRVPGVHAVLTGFDIPEMLVGRFLRDMPVLARDVVRLRGRRLQRWLQRISTLRRRLCSASRWSTRSSPRCSIRSRPCALTRQCCTDFMSYTGRVPGPQEHPNVVARNTWKNGDVEQGFREAAHVFEHTFRTQHQHQAYIEPHASVLSLDTNGRVQVWINSKMPFQVRQQLAEGIDVPQDMVCVYPTLIGG